MLKNTALSLLFALSVLSPFAQVNLILNGGFEDYSACPGDVSQLNNCTSWFTPSIATSDYFNPCATVWYASVPTNIFGTCTPYEGNAYAGGYFSIPLYDTTQYIEYIQGQTSSPLQQGQTYKLSMEVSLAGTSAFAIDRFGAYFSADPFYEPTSLQLDLDPQCTFFRSDFFDTIGEWMHVETTFVAEGGESYLTIGSFPGDTNRLIMNFLVDFTCYMYIDDVKLVEYTESEEPEEPEEPENPEEPEEPEEPNVPPLAMISIPNIFTPNGDGKNDFWIPSLPGYETYDIIILNRWGGQIYQAHAANFSWNGETTNGAKCTEGVYFYRIIGTDISGWVELSR
jgi:gliding motility-associated-like protein